MADVFQQYNKRNVPFLNDIRGHLSVDLRLQGALECTTMSPRPFAVFVWNLNTDSRKKTEATCLYLKLKHYSFNEMTGLQ